MKEKPIGIIGAMDMEVNAILEEAALLETEEHAGMAFYRALLSGEPVVVVRCSEGKVNAALCTQAMIDFYSPRFILNIGVAGGLGPDVHIGDAVVASACVQHDFDPTALGTPLGEISVPAGGDRTDVIYFPCDKALSAILAREAQGVYSGTVHTGVIATGDQFVADPALGNSLHKTFGALACEMESAAVAHVCMANGVPCVVLRSISDNANDSDTMDFRTFAEDSAQKAQTLLTAVIKKVVRG